jgi:hypothetical protein
VERWRGRGGHSDRDEWSLAEDVPVEWLSSVDNAGNELVEVDGEKL